MTPRRDDDAQPQLTIRATERTLPFGAVTKAETDGWAVIDVERLEVVPDRLYATEDEALAAAAELRRRREVNERANRNFDEDMAYWRDDGFGALGDSDD